MSLSILGKAYNSVSDHVTSCFATFKEPIHNHRTISKVISVALITVGFYGIIIGVGYGIPRTYHLVDKSFIPDFLRSVGEISVSIASRFFDIAANLWDTALKSSSVFFKGLNWLLSLPFFACGGATFIPVMSIWVTILSCVVILPTAPGLLMIKAGSSIWHTANE